MGSGLGETACLREGSMARKLAPCAPLPLRHIFAASLPFQRRSERRATCHQRDPTYTAQLAARPFDCIAEVKVLRFARCYPRCPVATPPRVRARSPKLLE